MSRKEKCPLYLAENHILKKCKKYTENDISIAITDTLSEIY